MIKLTVLHNELPSFVNSLAGFSILVEAYGLRILYDTSIEDQIIQNTKKADIDVSNLDFVVLSHGHWDHTDGLKCLDYTRIKNLLAHPSCFEKKLDYKEGYSCGCEVPLEELQEKTNVFLSKEPKWLMPGKIVFLGEIPRENNFESQDAEDSTGTHKKDFVLDDSALVIKSERGVVVISGCSHSGICNIISYAERVTGEKVHAVLGGFHLFNDEVTDQTIRFFQQHNIEKIYPAHCLNDYAFSEFEKIAGIDVLARTSPPS